MKAIATLVLFFSFIYGNSQVVFEKYYGTVGGNNAGFFVQEVSNGFVLGGSTDNDGIIIKTNEFGDSLWQRNYPNGTVESLRSAINGSFMLAGTDYNSPYNGVYRQVDSSGNIVWDTITTSNPFSMYGIAAIQTPDGNFALLENDNYPFQEYLRIRKISSANYSTLWTKDISKVSACNSSSFQLSYDSSIVVANGAFDTPYPRLIISKTLPSGVFDWRKDYNFSGDTGIAGNSVVQTRDSGFIVVGYKVFGNPQSDYRLFLMKTDAWGDSLWTKEYNLNNSNAFPDVIQTADGGYALIGTVTYPPQGGNFDYRILLMKTNGNGDSLWTKEFTGYGLNEARKIIQTTDGGFAIIGTSTNQNINQNYLYLIKTDSLGNIVPIALPCNPALTTNIPDKCNPDSNLITVASFGSLPNDYYWYNSSWSMLKSDTGRTFLDSIASLPSGSYFVIINDSGVCGIDTLNFLIPQPVNFIIDSIKHTSCSGCADGVIYFTTSGGFPPYIVTIGSGIVSSTMITGLAAGTYSICAMDDSLCLSCNQVTILDDPTMISFESNENDFFISPNPSTDGIIKLALLSTSQENTVLRVMNSLGEEVHAEKLSNNNLLQSVNLQKLPSGIYFLTFQNTKAKKVIKILR